MTNDGAQVAEDRNRLDGSSLRFGSLLRRLAVCLWDLAGVGFRDLGGLGLSESKVGGI